MGRELDARQREPCRDREMVVGDLRMLTATAPAPARCESV